jgi:hypothetical protein
MINTSVHISNKDRFFALLIQREVGGELAEVRKKAAQDEAGT